VRNVRFDSIANSCAVTSEIVLAVIDEFAQVLALRYLANSNQLGTPLKQAVAIKAYKLWARPARQSRFSLIKRYFDSESVRDGQVLEQLWHVWATCQHGKYLSLTNARPALRLINALLQIGFRKNSLCIVSAKGATPIDSRIGALKLEVRPCKRRKGVADHRLFIADRSISAKDASGASIAMQGLHWWFLVLGSQLLSKGKI
jgi:hypothetical protein